MTKKQVVVIEVDVEGDSVSGCLRRSGVEATVLAGDGRKPSSAEQSQIAEALAWDMTLISHETLLSLGATFTPGRRIDRYELQGGIPVHCVKEKDAGRRWFFNPWDPKDSCTGHTISHVSELIVFAYEDGLKEGRKRLREELKDLLTGEGEG